MAAAGSSSFKNTGCLPSTPNNYGVTISPHIYHLTTGRLRAILPFGKGGKGQYPMLVSAPLFFRHFGYPSVTSGHDRSACCDPLSTRTQDTLTRSRHNFEAPIRCASISSGLLRGTFGRHQLHCSAFLLYKVLRFLQAGHCIPPRLIRVNRQLRIKSYLAAKGGVLIRGLNLVAWPAGSERRNHPLYHVVIQSN